MKNEDLKKDLWMNIDNRKKLESELRNLEQELLNQRENKGDLEASKMSDVNTLRE